MLFCCCYQIPVLLCCYVITLQQCYGLNVTVLYLGSPRGWCRRGWFSIQCKCNIFKHPRLPTPPARAPWTVAASRLEQYNDGRAVVVLLKTRVKSEQTLLRNRVWKSRSWWQYDASPTTQPQIMDTKGAIARRMRSSRKRCVYPMSQHHNRAQRSPCGRLHLASSLRSAGKLCLLGRRSSSTCFGERP